MSTFAQDPSSAGPSYVCDLRGEKLFVAPFVTFVV